MCSPLWYDVKLDILVGTCNKRLHIATLAEMIWDSGTDAHPMYSGADLAEILGGHMGGSIRLGWG